MSIKIIIQEEQRRKDVDGLHYTDETYFETTHEMTSSDRKVVAGTLRSIADSFDPPEKAYRG